jgi:hypothetical protein
VSPQVPAFRIVRRHRGFASESKIPNSYGSNSVASALPHSDLAVAKVANGETFIEVSLCGVCIGRVTGVRCYYIV